MDPNLGTPFAWDDGVVEMTYPKNKITIERLKLNVKTKTKYPFRFSCDPCEPKQPEKKDTADLIVDL